MNTYSIRCHIGRAVCSILAALFLSALGADAASVFDTHRIDLSRNRVSTSGFRIRLVSGQVSPSQHPVKHGMDRQTDYRVRHGFAKNPDTMVRRSW